MSLQRSPTALLVNTLIIKFTGRYQKHYLVDSGHIEGADGIRYRADHNLCSLQNRGTLDDQPGNLWKLLGRR